MGELHHYALMMLHAALVVAVEHIALQGFLLSEDDAKLEVACRQVNAAQFRAMCKDLQLLYPEEEGSGGEFAESESSTTESYSDLHLWDLDFAGAELGA